VEKAEAVILVWSFTNPNKLPCWVPQRKYQPEQYFVRRVNEALILRASEENITRERGPMILDTGRHLVELKFCEGGYTIYNELVRQGWKIYDLWWEKRESEESKVKRKGRIKIRVNMVLSRKKPRKEIKPPLNLLKSCWMAHVWDNLIPKKNFVIHFTFKLRERPAIVITPT